MEIISIKNNDLYLKEYITLCSKEWGTNNNTNDYIEKKLNEIKNTSKVIDILALVDDEMIGFISLFNEDDNERNDLSPWYATMYVKDKYRGKNYSKILNDALINRCKELGYKKIYLKSYLNNYYEKFNAKYIETLNNGEKLYYIDIT